MDKFNTPKAKCLWACLQTPNVAKDTKYKDAYQATLVLDPENQQHKDLLNKIASLHKQSGGSAKAGEAKHPIKIHKDADGNSTKLYDVKFRSYRKNPIPTFDAKANKILRESNFVGNDSTIAVNWSYDFYSQGQSDGGVSLWINAVQIFELVEYTGGEASDFDLGVGEGYEDVKDDFETKDHPSEIEAKEEAAKMTPDPQEKQTTEEAQAETEVSELDLPF